MTHELHNMTRLNADITTELSTAIRTACEFRPFGPAIEDWLWQIPEIQQAAKRAGVVRQRRRYKGERKRRENR